MTSKASKITLVLILLFGLIGIGVWLVYRHPMLPASLVLEPNAERRFNLKEHIEATDYRTSKSHAEVMAFYQSQLAAEGWTVDSQSTLNGGTDLIVAHREADQLTMNIYIVPEPTKGQQHVIISYWQSKN